MSSTSNPTPRGLRGRPRSFEVDVVTDRALIVFWERGYEATSLDALVAVTGLNVSSLYAAYGSKRGLFRAALERYEHHVGSALDAMEHGRGGLDDVIRFVEWVRVGLSADAHPTGCLVVNTMVELAVEDPEIGEVAARYRARVLRSIGAALARADALGEIEPRTRAPRSTVVQAAVFGALVTARSGATEEASKMLRDLVAELRRWRRRI